MSASNTAPDFGPFNDFIRPLVERGDLRRVVIELVRATLLSKFLDTENDAISYDAISLTEANKGKYEGLRNSATFNDVQRAKINHEIERALADHDLFILRHFSCFQNNQFISVASDWAQSEGLDIPSILEKDKAEALATLEGMDLEEEMKRIESYSDNDFLEAKIAETEQMIEERDHLLREKMNGSFEISGDRLGLLQKVDLDEQLRELKNFRNPKYRKGILKRVKNNIKRRDKMKEKLAEAIKKQKRLSEILSELPGLEIAYRYAIAEIKEANYFSPNTRIPSFIEICYTLFNIEQSKYQPENYKSPEGLDVVMPKVIKTLQNNPEMIRSIMMLGVTGHYPAIIQHDKNGFLIASTAKGCGIIHGKDCLYDKAVKDFTRWFTDGNAMDRAGFMSSLNSRLNLMCPLVYIRIQSYENEEYREMLTQRHLNRIGVAYENLPEDFSQSSTWAEGSFDSPGSSWLDTPKEVRDDTSAFKGYRIEPGVYVDRVSASEPTNTVWRASLRGLWI